jgi:alkylhydroperoxidase family enzyme
MARLPYLEADQVAPEYRDMLKRNTNLHKLLVNSPDMARAFNGIGGYIRFNSKLDPRLRELAILQVGWMEKSEYEFTHHVKIGREFGVTDQDIEGLMAETRANPRSSSRWRKRSCAAPARWCASLQCRTRPLPRSDESFPTSRWSTSCSPSPSIAPSCACWRP